MSYRRRETGWTENIIHIVEMQNTYEILIRKFKGNNLLNLNREDNAENIFKKSRVRVWIGCIRLRTGTCSGLL